MDVELRQTLFILVIGRAAIILRVWRGTALALQTLLRVK